MVGLTDPLASGTAGNGATLAACQRDAIAPTPAGIAVFIACEVARALKAVVVRGKVTPESIFIRYDGGVELLKAIPPKIAYSAPEQIKGGGVDKRADVFSLGIVLWELLTATRLFERDSPIATRRALLDDPVLDVRDVNPDVPAIVGDVLGTALQRDKNARFDSVDAFCMALTGAVTSSGVAMATAAELGQWVAERVPPLAGAAVGAAASVPELDVPARWDAPTATAPNRVLDPAPALPPPAVVAPPIAHAPSAMSAVPELDIPAFDTTAMAAEALRPSQLPPPTSAAPPSPDLALPRVSSSPSMPEAPSLGRSSGSTKSIAFDAGDDDDFDMEIERNVANSMQPTSTSSRVSGGPRSSGSHEGRRSGGLELAAPSRMAREGAAAAARDYGEPGTGIKLAGLLLATIISGAAAFALWKYVRHHAGGLDVMLVLPHAFDGTSAPESGAIALVSLVIAVTVGYLGLRFKPHAWAFVAAAGATLIFSLAMVTVTLASTGENPTPPDGALLVPYLFPAALLLLALGFTGRAARLFAVGGVGRRLAVLPVAAIAGTLAFLALQASHFAR